MTGALKRTYFTFLAPAGLGLIVLQCAHGLDLFAIGEVKFIPVIAPLVFVLSVLFAVALPILLRTLFAHKNRNQINTSEVDLIQFERRLIYIISIPPYLALTACLLELPLFYTAGTALATLYAVYYYYPSQKRIQFDRRIFRVR